MTHTYVCTYVPVQTLHKFDIYMCRFYLDGGLHVCGSNLLNGHMFTGSLVLYDFGDSLAFPCPFALASVEVGV